MPTNLTPQQMKQFVRDHFDEFVNKRNTAVIRRNMTPDFYDHDGPGGKPTGIEGDGQMMVAMCQNMPDLQVTVEEMIALVQFAESKGETADPAEPFKRRGFEFSASEIARMIDRYRRLKEAQKFCAAPKKLVRMAA